MTMNMGSSLVGVYITTKTSPIETLKHGEKNDMVTNMATLLARNIYQEVKFLEQSQTLIQLTWPPENYDLRLFVFFNLLLLLLL